MSTYVSTECAIVPEERNPTFAGPINKKESVMRRMSEPISTATSKPKRGAARVILATILAMAGFVGSAQPALADDLVIVNIGSKTTMWVTTTTEDWQGRPITLSVIPTFSGHTSNAVTLEKFKLCYSAQSRHVANIQPTIHNGAGTYSVRKVAKGAESGTCRTWQMNKRFYVSRDAGDHLFRINTSIDSRSASSITIAGFRR